MVREILLPAIKVCQMYSNLPSHQPLSPSPQLSSTKMSKIENLKLQRRKSIRLKMYSNLLLSSQPFPKPTKTPVQRNKILKQPILKSTKLSVTHYTKYLDLLALIAASHIILEFFNLQTCCIFQICQNCFRQKETSENAHKVRKNTEIKFI